MTGTAREFGDRRFVVAKGLLPREQVEALTSHLERLSGRTRASFEDFRVAGKLLKRGVYRGWTLPDGVSKTAEFWDLVFLPGLLDVVREVLSPEARFLQHTDLHVGFSAVNWHRDSVTRALGTGGDWDESGEPYRLARVGFYLQSHAESRFALGLVPGSHRHGGAMDEAGLADLERRTAPWRQAVALALGRDPVAGRAEWVPAESGDAIVSDPRIVHSGSFIEGPKYSAFLAYGVPDAASRASLANAFLKRDDWPGLRAPRWLRRAAIVPPALVADAVVGHHARSAVDLASLDLDAFTGIVVPFVATAGVYLFAVVGPREAAGATVLPAPWILRFASYFVALASSSAIVSRTLTT